MAKDLKNILLSTIEENKIKEKTPDKLPLNPTAEGWSGHEVRRFLAKSLIDSEGSFLAEFKNKMIEIKAQFEDIFGQGDGDIQGQIDSIIENIEEIDQKDETVLQKVELLDETKLSKNITSLVAETELSLSDVFVFDKGSGARKITLSRLAEYITTTGFKLFTIVEELPTENQNPNTIYLLATENEDGENQLLEYIWIVNENRWELIGSLEVGFYEPDDTTIGLNAEQKLEVKNNLEIDGGFL